MRRKYGLELANPNRVLLKKYWTLAGVLRGQKKLEEKYNLSTTWVVINYIDVWV